MQHLQAISQCLSAMCIYRILYTCVFSERTIHQIAQTVSILRFEFPVWYLLTVRTESFRQTVGKLVTQHMFSRLFLTLLCFFLLFLVIDVRSQTCSPSTSFFNIQRRSLACPNLLASKTKEIKMCWRCTLNMMCIPSVSKILTLSIH